MSPLSAEPPFLSQPMSRVENHQTPLCPCLNPRQKGYLPNEIMALPRRMVSSPDREFPSGICSLIRRNAHTGFMTSQSTGLRLRQTHQSVRDVTGPYPPNCTPTPPPLLLQRHQNNRIIPKKRISTPRNKGLTSCTLSQAPQKTKVSRAPSETPGNQTFLAQI